MAALPGAGQKTRRPRFSLVLATVDRTDEVERFLCSLDRQNGVALELIVVDQNPDERLLPYLQRRGDAYRILHLRSEPGLSRARNVGLRHASGEIIAFPDDDCWYPPGLLDHVSSLLQDNAKCDGVTGRSIDASGRPSGGRFASRPRRLDVLGVWSQAISYTIFLKDRVVASVGEFDERLGVGAGTAFGSGEETDYLVRAIRSGFRLEYLPDLKVCHPNPLAVWNRRTVRRAYDYGAGMGLVVRKHGYPFWFKGKILARPLAGALLAMAALHPGRSRYYLGTFLGRLKGLSSPI